MNRMALLILVLFAAMANAATIDVYPGAGTIAGAVDGASDGDTIRLAGEGVYTGDWVLENDTWVWHYAIDPNGKDLIFTSQNPNDPDTVAATIIDGYVPDFDTGGKSRSGPEWQYYWESCKFLANGGQIPNCQMEGLTIRAGEIADAFQGSTYAVQMKDNSDITLSIRKCRFIGSSDNDGGGIWCNDVNNLTVDDCSFSDISLGPGYTQIIYGCDSNVLIKDSHFYNNDTNTNNVDTLSVIYCQGYGNVTIDNCIIDGENQFESGIKFYKGNNPVAITDSTISNNNVSGIIVNYYATGEPNGVLIEDCNISYNGLGINISVDQNTQVLIKDCTISNNEDGGGILIWGVGDVTVDNCLISNNKANTGGGIYNSLIGTTTVTNCIITGNEAVTSGGGFFVVNTDSQIGVNIDHCIIAGNTAGYDIGGLLVGNDANVTNCLIIGNEAENETGGLDADGSNIINCTIADNHAGDLVGGTRVHNGANLTNCILWGNEDLGTIENDWDFDQIWGGTDITISHCVIQDSQSVEYKGKNYLIDIDAPDGPDYYYTIINYCFGQDCGGSTSEDPLFADDYHPGEFSSAIDAGDNSVVNWEFDIDGDDRVIGGIVDIGADEVARAYNQTQDTWHTYINDALDDANNGDEIIVYPGIYHESLDISKLGSGLDCTIRSIDPNDWDVVAATVIDGNGATNTVGFYYGSEAHLSGFTITGGTNGVYSTYGDSSTISRCIIRDNSSVGVLSTSGSNFTVTNCIIKDNGAQGIFSEQGGPAILNNLIYGNDGGIMLYQSVSDGVVRNNTIANNTNYGISYGDYVTATISNCIIWNNNNDLNNCSATYSCIEDGDAGTGNISSDPCFVDSDSNDFHLSIDSPCIEAGDPNGNYDGQADIDGDTRVYETRVDMGADEVNVPIPDAHLWKLDDTSGIITYDSIDNNDGTFNGNDPCWTDGLISGAVDLNGVSDYFSISTLNGAYTPYSNTFSVAGWFKTSQTAGMQTIVGNWAKISSNHFGWQILVENNNVVARFGAASSTTSDIVGTSTVTDNNWHHFVMVFPTKDANTVLYVDGQSEGTPQQKYGYLNSTKFRIGDGSFYAYGTPDIKGGPFCGMIDDVMIFNYALTEEEVERLYEAGL